MKKILFLIFLSFSNLFIFGQNLIENGGFEDGNYSVPEGQDPWEYYSEEPKKQTMLMLINSLFKHLSRHVLIAGMLQPYHTFCWSANRVLVESQCSTLYTIIIKIL